MVMDGIVDVYLTYVVGLESENELWVQSRDFVELQLSVIECGCKNSGNELDFIRDVIVALKEDPVVLDADAFDAHFILAIVSVAEMDAVLVDEAPEALQVLLVLESAD